MKKIIFQGDSITDANKKQTNDQLGFGYVAILKDKIVDYTILNKGISGNRLPELLERWEVDTINEKPEMLFILVGINEIWHKYKHNKAMTPKIFKENYEELLTKTKKQLPETKICLLEPFALPIGHYEDTWTSDLLSQQRIVYELSFKYHTGFIPLQKIIDEALAKYEMKDILPDGVHPSLLGHQIIADAVMEYLTLVL